MKTRAIILKTKNYIKKIIIYLILIIGFFHQGIAQETAKKSYVEIKLAERTKVVDELVEDHKDQFVIISPSMGEITISKSKIKSYKELPEGNIVDGVYWAETTNAIRNIYAPTAYVVPFGKGWKE